MQPSIAICHFDMAKGLVMFEICDLLPRLVFVQNIKFLHRGDVVGVTVTLTHKLI